MGGVVSAGANNFELVDNLVNAEILKTTEVERVFRAVDRGAYYLAEHREGAYKDRAWRHKNLHLSAPCIYGEVMEALKLEKGQSFLNLGSGTGYLSTMAGLILGPYGLNHGVEIHQDVIDYSETQLKEFISSNSFFDAFEFCPPVFHFGNCLNLASTNMKYDRVYCGAACPSEQEDYMKSLVKIGGLLVMPLDDELVQIRRLSESEWKSKRLMAVSFADLIPSTSCSCSDLIELTEPSALSLQDLCRIAIRGVLRKNIELENPNDPIFLLKSNQKKSQKSRGNKSKRTRSSSKSPLSIDADLVQNSFFRIGVFQPGGGFMVIRGFPDTNEGEIDDDCSMDRRVDEEDSCHVDHQIDDGSFNHEQFMQEGTSIDGDNHFYHQTDGDSEIDEHTSGFLIHEGAYAASNHHNITSTTDPSFNNDTSCDNIEFVEGNGKIREKDNCKFNQIFNASEDRMTGSENSSKSSGPNSSKKINDAAFNGRWNVKNTAGKVSTSRDEDAEDLSTKSPKFKKQKTGYSGRCASGNKNHGLGEEGHAYIASESSTFSPVEKAIRETEETYTRQDLKVLETGGKMGEVAETKTLDFGNLRKKSEILGELAIPREGNTRDHLMSVSSGIGTHESLEIDDETGFDSSLCEQKDIQTASSSLSSSTSLSSSSDSLSHPDQSKGKHDDPCDIFPLSSSSSSSLSSPVKKAREKMLSFTRKLKEFSEENEDECNDDNDDDPNEPKVKVLDYKFHMEKKIQSLPIPLLLKYFLSFDRI